MPQFSYKARRRSGEVVEGMLEVADRSAALVQIERLGLFPVAVDAAKGGAAAGRPIRSPSRPRSRCSGPDWSPWASTPSGRTTRNHNRLLQGAVPERGTVPLFLIRDCPDLTVC